MSQKSKPVMQHSLEVLKELGSTDLDRLSEILSIGFDKDDDLETFVPMIFEAPHADLLVSRIPERRLIASMMIVNMIHSTGGLGGRIDNVATHPDSREQGHAGALLDFALEWFQDREVKHVSLESEDERWPAHRLYESRGFKVYETNQFQLTLP